MEPNFEPTRRKAVTGIAVAPALALLGCAAQTQPAAGSGKTYVLVHGAWHGAWCWSRVANGLRQRGHRVYLPTQTGLGDRQHLLSPSITLDTFVADVVSAIETEELNDVILVGHSFGGLSVTGAASRIPQRLRHLVYLDSLILQSGQSLIDGLGTEAAAQRRSAYAAAGHVLPAPPPAYFGVTDEADTAWLRRRLTAHPSGTWETPMNLNGPVGLGRRTTYIACTQPRLASVAKYVQFARDQPGWKVLELAAAHDAMVTAPQALVEMLVAVD